jgi:putative CocE/NonD family hydrolase
MRDFSVRCALAVVLALGFVTATASASAGQDAAKKQEPRVTLTEAELDGVTGLYGNAAEPESEISISREGRQVFAEGIRNPRVEVFAVSRDRFVMDAAMVEFDFTRDASGKATAISTKLSGNAGPVMQRLDEKPKKLNHFRDYTKQDVMIPARDGVKLHVVILRPSNKETGGSETSGEPLPFLLVRTPYGVDGLTSDRLNAGKPELAASGYIFVLGDIRGRYKSEGQFVMNRPIVAHLSNKDVDETTDTRDTIDWLLKNVPNNSGKGGVYGVSYPGFLAMMAGIDAHPAVKAISPQAPMTNIWLGDDFFHNGAFRETYGFDYVQQLEAQKTDVPADSKEDQYNFFLEHVNFAGAAAAAKIANLPTAKEFIAEPAYVKFWRDMAVEPHLTKVEVPTLEVGGWWDQEDMWGTQAEYAALKPHDKKGEVFMVLGPWNHGGWGGSGRSLGAINFGEATGDTYRKRIETPFFEKYLKDRGGFDLAGVASFRTGVDEWERYDVWPPVKGFRGEKLYLSSEHGLGFTAPTGDYNKIAAAYVADPADPIPYRQRPIESTYGNGSHWRQWLVEDQRFVTGRKDLATFSTAALDHDVTVTGDVVADLFAATTGTDADWVVKLIDVYPDDAPASGTTAMAGYQLMIVDEIFRGRYAKSFETPEPISPSDVAEYKWSLHGADHTFLKGHKIMVVVQSSWFPLYDRNPQTFVPNIMTAPADAYKAETMTIYGSPKYPSHLEFLTPN